VHKMLMENDGYLKRHGTENDIQNTMKILSGFELGFVVGIFEGEGWFGIRKRENYRVYAQCSVKSTDEEVLDKLVFYLGIDFSVVKERNVPANKNWKIPYSVTFTGNTALKIANQLYPYLSERRKRQIDKMRKYNAISLSEFNELVSVKNESIKEGD